MTFRDHALPASYRVQPGYGVLHLAPDEGVERLLSRGGTGLVVERNYP